MEKREVKVETSDFSSSGSYEFKTKTPRVMSGFSAMMVVVASMVGTGVFTTTGLLLQGTQSAVAILVAWLIGGVVAFFGALSYAELVSIYPNNGGEFQLLTKIYHPSVGFIAGWVSLIVGFGAPIAAAAIAFGTYLSSVFPGVNVRWTAFGIIVLLSLIHAVKVSFGNQVQNVFTILKLIVVFVFIIGGLSLGDFGLIFHESLFDTGSVMLSPAFAVGLILVTYAYSGWNGAAYLAGEVKNPRKSLPVALALGTGIVTLIYLGLNAVFLSVAPMSELTGVIDVGAVAAMHLFGDGVGRVLSGIIALLLVSSLSAMIMAGPRVYQSMGEIYPCFQFFTIRLGSSGPLFAIAFQAVVSLGLMMTASFDALLAYMGFTLSISAALTVFGVFVMRKRAGDLKRSYKCWGYPITPMVFIALSAWMVVFTLIEEPIVALWGIGTVLAGLLMYFGARNISFGAPNVPVPKSEEDLFPKNGERAD